jgi:hypothetical protein
MEKIVDIIGAKYPDVKIMDEKILQSSGTGYIYPPSEIFSGDTVMKFYEGGRLGYLIRLEIVNETGEAIHMHIVLHQRFSDSTKVVAICSPSSFYPDCIIRDYYEDEFFERFGRLMKGETVEQWSSSKDKCQIRIGTWFFRQN